MAFKILYIEDSDDNMLLFRRMFRVTDYEFIEAVDGESGYQKAVDTEPNLILLDMGLPDIDGTEVIRRIKLIPALQAIPIIAVTADLSEKMAKKCLELGCVRVLHKPVSRFVLLDAIRQFSEAVVNPNAPAVASGQLKKVLIAEDNPDLRVIFATVFDHHAFSVEVAVDGVEALEHIQQNIPDVVILDINMPRLTGFEVLQHIRQHEETKHIKVIMVTGNAVAAHDEQAEAADLMLTKPVSIRDLLTLAQRLIST